MKAVRGHEGKPVLVEVDEPPGRGEAISMQVVGICASDLNYLRRGTSAILGHELAGLRSDGTQVAVEGMFGCGGCEYCLEGRNNLCAQATKAALGMLNDGGMVEQFRVPSHKLIPLPVGLGAESASLCEPGSVAWHGVRKAGGGPGKRVAVIGGGSIGLLAVAAAQRQGADDVAIEVRYPHQHEIRERFRAAEPTGLYDAVVEAAGSPSALRRAVELVRPGGTVSMLGVHLDGIDVPYSMLLTKEVTLVASLGYCGTHAGEREMVAVAEMLAARPEIAESVITHRFPIEDAAEAFRVAADRQAGAIKVVIDVR